MADKTEHEPSLILQLLKKLPLFNDTEGLLPCSQQPATDPYFDPN